MSDKPAGQPPSDDPGGIKPTDLLALPPDERKVMRVVLRHHALTRPGIADVIESLPAEERIPPYAVDAALRALIERGWVLQQVESGGVYYRIGTINRTSLLNQTYSKKVDPTDTKPNPKLANRRKTGLERISNFWGKLTPQAEQDMQNKSSSAGKFGREEEGEKSTSTEGSSTSGTTRNEAQREGFVSSLFKEFAGGKAKNLEDLPEEKQAAEPPPTPQNLGHISKLFEELRAKPAGPQEDDETKDK